MKISDYYLILLGHSRDSRSSPRSRWLNLNLSLMAQIALPQFSDSALGFVRVPSVPQNPPNNKDVVAAALLVRDLTQNYGMS